MHPKQIQTQGVCHNAEARKAHRRRTEHRVQLPAEQRDPYARSQRNTDDIVNEGPEQILVNVPEGRTA